MSNTRSDWTVTLIPCAVHCPTSPSGDRSTSVPAAGAAPPTRALARIVGDARGPAHGSGSGERMSGWGGKPGRFRRPQNLLSYPGGKYRGAETIMRSFPKGLTEMASPFMGGASVEIRMAQKGVRVYGYDNSPALINFWQAAILMPFELAQKLEDILPDVPGGDTPQPAYTAWYKARSQQYRDLETGMDKAAWFLVLNATAYAGKTFMSATKACDYPGPRPERVRCFRAPKLSAMRSDFRESIPRYARHFMYLDPPYMDQTISGYYHQRSGDTFGHVALRDLLLARENWVMSYNDHPVIREWYGPTCDIQEVSWTYNMRVNIGTPQTGGPAGKGNPRGHELLVSRA